MSDTINQPVEPPSFEKQMIAYLYSQLRLLIRGYPDTAEIMPQWVPSAIRITGSVKSGDWPCMTTAAGVIHVSATGGGTVAIDVLDCEILAFRWNQKREILLREIAEGTDLKSQISNLKSHEENP